MKSDQVLHSSLKQGMTKNKCWHWKVKTKQKSKPLSTIQGFLKAIRAKTKSEHYIAPKNYILVYHLISSKTDVSYRNDWES